MELREGGTYRIYDGTTWHAAIGGAYICDGSHRPFVVRFFKNGGRGYVGGREFSVTIPKLSFHTAFRLRKVGALRVYGLQTRMLRRLALRPKS